MNISQLLHDRFHAALSGLVDDPTPYAGMVKPAQDARFGDYQANCAMPLAKVLGRKPQELAKQIVERFDRGDMIDDLQVAGPGFINIKLRGDWLAAQLRANASDKRLGIAPARQPRGIVVDFSSPNVAKPMHVGHLRSTIIGDCLARLFRFLGHRVITDNHLGDWGQQFGILLYGYKHFRDEQALATNPVHEMVRLYIHVRGLMKAGEGDEADDLDNAVALAVRQETAKLHAGDEENNRLWRLFIPWCQAAIDRIYERLGVRFDHTLGESFYNPMLSSVVDSLLARGVARSENGAVGIFFGDEEPPAFVRRNNAYTYTATDLATIQYRIEQWRPDVMLYVVDARQALHFKNLFAAARRWGYDKVALEHVSFGSVLGADRKPIKTREGGAVELDQLLDEAIERADTVYAKSRQERLERGEDLPPLGPEERRRVAELVGIGAVKYADLSQNRASDYIFSWEKMLAMDGNTATYMQYAYARNRSIFRKGGEERARFESSPPQLWLADPSERQLGLAIMRLSESLEAAAAEFKPNLITSYLWDLSKAYSGFFQNCPVLKAENPEQRASRLLLSDMAARTIQLSLELLGIGTVDQM
jgi:arginyl-tRNA synthetase